MKLQKRILFIAYASIPCNPPHPPEFGVQEHPSLFSLRLLRRLVGLYRLQKGLPIPLRLLLPHAGDGKEFLHGGRAAGRHIRQRRIGKNDIGRQPLPLGQAQAQRLKRAQQPASGGAASGRRFTWGCARVFRITRCP